jgi:two-component system response regulator YesN
MSKSPSLKEVAEHFHFSTGHLSRLIKKETGMTYPQYLNQIRLEAARMLLCKSDLDIGKIAYEVGYQEVSHFNRVFKKTMGMNPTKYRKLSSH